MSAQMTSHMLTDALVRAIWRRGPPKELRHRSDRGSQYTSAPFQKLMTDHRHPPFDDPARRAVRVMSGTPLQWAAIGCKGKLLPVTENRTGQTKTKENKTTGTRPYVRRHQAVPTPRHSPSTEQTLRRSSKKLPKSNSNSLKYTEGQNVAFALSSISACSVKQSEDEHRSD